MDINALMQNAGYGTSNLSNLNLPSGIGQTLPTDYSALLGNSGKGVGAGSIGYGSLSTGSIHYADINDNSQALFMQNAMNGDATMTDFMSLFEGFQTKMMTLLLKALQAAGLSEAEILKLMDTLTSGRGQDVMAAFKESGLLENSGGTKPSTSPSFASTEPTTLPAQTNMPAQAQHVPAASQAPMPEASVPGSEEVSGPVAPPTAGSTELHLPPALEPYRTDILNAAEKSGMPASIIAGMIWAESRGNLGAVTTNGGNGLADSGLMQINSNTFAGLKAQHPELLGNANVNDAGDNILAGALYLREQYDAFGGDMGAALRAYNSGPNNVNTQDLRDISKTGTGNPNYVDYVTQYAHTIETGQGELPA